MSIYTVIIKNLANQLSMAFNDRATADPELRY